MSDTNSPSSQPDSSSWGNSHPEQGRDPFTGRPYPAQPADEDLATTRHIRQPPPQGQSEPHPQGQPGPQWQPTPSHPSPGGPGPQAGSQSYPGARQYSGQPQYPGQPQYYGSQPYPGPPQHPTGSSAVDASEPKTTSRLPLILTVGLLALALVAASVYFLTRGGDDKTGPSATPASTQTVQQSTSSSSEGSSTPPSSETSTESPTSTDSPSGTGSPSATESSASSVPSGNLPADPGQWKDTSAAGLKPPTEFSVWKKTDTSATTSVINVYQRSDGVPGGMVVMVIPVGDGSQARARLRNPVVVNGAVCGDASPENSRQPSNVCVIDLGGGGYVTATSSGLGGSPESVGKDLDEWMKKASA